MLGPATMGVVLGPYVLCTRCDIHCTGCKKGQFMTPKVSIFSYQYCVILLMVLYSAMLHTKRHIERK